MIIKQFNPLFDSENDYFITNQIENDFYNPFYIEQNLNINDISPNFQVNNSFSILSKNKLNINSSNNIEEIKSEIVKNNKSKPFFKINQEIPHLILEKDIIGKIKIMNLHKEIKIKLISCINEASDKKEEIKNKLLLKPKERRKNLNKVRKIYY